MVKMIKLHLAQNPVHFMEAKWDSSIPRCGPQHSCHSPSSSRPTCPPHSPSPPPHSPLLHLQTNSLFNYYPSLYRLHAQCTSTPPHHPYTPSCDGPASEGVATTYRQWRQMSVCTLVLATSGLTRVPAPPSSMDSVFPQTDPSPPVAQSASPQTELP